MFVMFRRDRRKPLWPNCRRSDRDHPDRDRRLTTHVELPLISRAGLHRSRAGWTRSSSPRSAITVFFTILICFLILFFAIKYRRGSRADRSNPVDAQHHARGRSGSASRWLSRWCCSSSATYVFFHMYHAPEDASEIYVLGRQWMWELQHPEGRREINELHVPVGRPVRLTMTSQDVIHSFLHPGVPDQAGRGARAGTRRSGSSRPSRGRTTCSAPSIAGRSTRG